MASIPGAGGFLRNETVRSIVVWGVLARLLDPLLAPLINEIQAEYYPHFPNAPLSPGEAAAATVKSHMTAAEGAAEAAINGIDEERFRLLVAAIQNPPGVETLLEMWRRDLIPESGSGIDSTSIEQGIREGQTGNKWIESLKKLRYQLPAPGSALRALLEGQIDRPTAEQLYAQWGGEPKFFELLFNTEGSAPTPNEAAEMARRGIVPWEGEGPGVVSYRQAFLEGPWRNKWEQPYRALADYIPPPRATTAMLRNGSITDEQALKFYAAAGAKDEVAAALLADAHHRSTEADRELTKADILGLYMSQEIERASAESMLGGLGYTGATAAYLLDYTDFRRDKGLLDRAVAKVAGLYIGHKIDKQAALAALDSLGLAAGARDNLLRTWDLEREVSVKLLTPAEIATAAKMDLISADEAWRWLVDQGYTERDATLYLLVHKVQPPAGSASA